MIEIPIPDDVGRKAILQLNIDKMSTKKIQLKAIIDKTSGFSGAEIKATCVEAGMIAIRQGRGYITQDDFLESIKRINVKKINGGLKDSPDSIYN